MQSTVSPDTTAMSPFAEAIFHQKYAHIKLDGTKETWAETARRVATHVLGAVNADSALIARAERLIAGRKFMPGGRYLYATGRPMHQTQNCFDGSTRFVTDRGVRSLAEVAGQQVTVLNRFGEWEQAEVQAFGEQELYRVTFANGDQVLATANHEWWQVDGTKVTTLDLEEVPFTVVASLPELDEEGIRHGIIYGDGHVIRHRKTKQPSYSAITFVNPLKGEELLQYFEPETRPVTVGFGAQIAVETVRSTKAGKVVSLQPLHYKELPSTYSPAYARGFIAGLIATDGNVATSGSVTISCEGLAKARRIAEIAVCGGCVVTSVRVVSRTNPFTGGERELAQVSIKPFSAPLIRPSQQAVVAGRKMATRLMQLAVESVDPTGITAPVYCVVAPRTQSFTLANGLTTSNCLLLRAEDSREGWADLLHKASMALMTGAGIGVVYSDVRPEGAAIHRTGGTATGPLALMQMVNEVGRGVMQGGSRRSAIWAGLHWDHPDCMKFVTLKNWSPEVRALKERDYNFPATLDGTNISVILDDAFFQAYHDDQHAQHALAHGIYWATVRQMLKTAEPGFSIDAGPNAGEHLRNAPVTGDTHVLTDTGYREVGSLIGQPVTVWTGKQWAPNVVFKETYPAAPVVKVGFTGGRSLRCDPAHPFLVERYHGRGKRRTLVGIERVPASQLAPGDVLHVSLPARTASPRDVEAYTLGYTYGDGSFGRGNAEITFCTQGSKACAAAMAGSARVSSVNERDARGFTRMYLRTDHAYWGGRDKGAFPVELYAATAAEQLSFVAGLFDADGNWEPTQHRLRLSSNYPAFLRGVARVLEQNGILASVHANGTSTCGQKQTYALSVMGDYLQRFATLVPTVRVKPDTTGWEPDRVSTLKVLTVEPDGVEPVFCADVRVPEHAFMAEGVIISNCTEVTSHDDSDICNLGSINMARIESLEDMAEAVEVATAFLLAGTVYSHLPYDQVDQVRSRNRRLGLGLMGLHEWLLKRGKRYGPDAELAEYLDVYAGSTRVARRYADQWGLSHPIKTRAIAPTGTIGIVAETTTGVEPIFCVAYKRRYLKGTTVHYQYVIDPAAKRLIDQGLDPEAIEDAYSLAEDVERRVAFQAWVQQYVDHAISSTINLPHWGSPSNNEGTVQAFGTMLLRYLPGLRGVTCYPDGARGGQPLTPVKYATAIKHVGEVFIEQADVCDLTKGGSCGS
jgi:hypothetical protein